MNALTNGGLLGCKDAFVQNYVKLSPPQSHHLWHQGPQADGARFTSELYHLLTKFVMIRRLKANVMKDLPPVTRQLIRVKLESSSSGARKADEAPSADDLPNERSSARASVGPEGDGVVPAKHAMALQLHQKLHDLALRKVPGAVKWIADKLAASNESGAKIVVFAHHRDVLDALEAGLAKRQAVRKCSAGLHV